MVIGYLENGNWVFVTLKLTNGYLEIGYWPGYLEDGYLIP